MNELIIVQYIKEKTNENKEKIKRKMIKLIMVKKENYNK